MCGPEHIRDPLRGLEKGKCRGHIWANPKAQRGRAVSLAALTQALTFLQSLLRCRHVGFEERASNPNLNTNPQALTLIP